MPRIRIATLAVAALAFAGATLPAQQASAPAAKTPSPGLRNQMPAVKARPSRPAAFGTTATSYVRLAASAFEVDNSGVGYTTAWDPASQVFANQKWITSGFAHMYASPQLPGGSNLIYAELDACDASTTGKHVTADLYYCNFDGTCPATPFATLVSVSDVANPCNGQFVELGTPAFVDNFYTQILADVHFDALDGSNTVAGMIFGYRLQVSPAPPTPTFGDVPASDFGFQYIEALAASGITGGCGGGNYCPDNPVTRRQMAIFIAKALGLNWDGF